MTPPPDLSEVPTRDLIFDTRWSVLLYASAGGVMPDNPIVLQIRQKVADEIASRLAGLSREPSDA
jgi:hypothetical protein